MQRQLITLTPSFAENCYWREARGISEIREGILVNNMALWCILAWAINSRYASVSVDDVITREDHQ
eukprot:scaffold6122_cov91-Skeletonema_dohrnii-CCMP3373.AAC.1